MRLLLPKPFKRKDPKKRRRLNRQKSRRYPPPPAPEPAQIASSIAPEVREKQPEDGPKTKKLAKVKKEKPIDEIEIARKDPPKPVLLQHSKLAKSKEAEVRKGSDPSAMKLTDVYERNRTPSQFGFLLPSLLKQKNLNAPRRLDERKSRRYLLLTLPNPFPQRLPFVWRRIHPSGFFPRFPSRKPTRPPT